MADVLSHQQRRALVAMSDGGERTDEQLGQLLETSAAGARRTAASLDRRDLLERTGHRRFRITAAGLDLIDHHQAPLVEA